MLPKACVGLSMMAWLRAGEPSGMGEGGRGRSRWKDSIQERRMDRGGFEDPFQYIQRVVECIQESRRKKEVGKRWGTVLMSV